MMASEIDALFDDAQMLARVRAEAGFGYGEMRDALDSLPKGARVLEVGCGTGYLLAAMAASHPHISLSGLEPAGPGFAAFDAVIARVSARMPAVTIHRQGIEGFTPADGGAYDLIFAVNVFEHLADWREGLAACARLLAPQGRLVILCPNYTVPYEPHFGLPLLLGKERTRRVFADRIARFEAEKDVEGLWASLNFITVGELAAACGALGLGVAFDRTMTARMFGRLAGDAEFSRRQGLLGRALALPARLGLGRAFSLLPASLQPYMKAVVTRP